MKVVNQLNEKLNSEISVSAKRKNHMQKVRGKKPLIISGVNQLHDD